MTFTKSQMAILAKYERSFRTAIRSNYASNLTSTAYAEIRTIYEQASGKAYHLKASCAKCVLDFLKLVGRHYFETAEDEVATEPTTKPKKSKKKQS